MYDYGFIYKLRSPSGKEYIGQVAEYIKVKDRYRRKGINGRWSQHCCSAIANDGKGCRVLNAAIRKYKPENFQVIKLMRCKLEVINLFEELYIKTHKTLVPSGYNLQEGGGATARHNKETCKRRSASLKALLQNPAKRKIWSLAKLGKRNPKKRKCKKTHNQNLPKYIYYRESNGGKYKGYVVESPYGKSKRFSKKSIGLEQNLKEAIRYLNLLKNFS